MDFCKAIILVCRKKRTRKGLSRLSLILIFFTMIFLGTPGLCVAPDKVIIYFYSSETNMNNFKSLKMGFDKYLSEYGPYEFQPFKDRETFEKHIKDKDKCLLLLSSWHFKNIAREYYLTFALTGLRDGKKYQQHILVALDKVSSIDSLMGARIASSSSVEHTKSVVSGMFKQKDAAEKVSILAVPKDIDALMSVGFRTSKAALVTRNTFEELENINPSMHGKMKILAEGRESLLLIVAVPKDFSEHAVQPVNVIKSMPMNPDGMKKMQMLGLDGWQEPDLNDRQTLEAR
jgi:hypothetical protein